MNNKTNQEILRDAKAMPNFKARIKVPKKVKKGEVFQIKTLTTHKMETGLRKNKKVYFGAMPKLGAVLIKSKMPQFN